MKSWWVDVSQRSLKYRILMFKIYALLSVCNAILIRVDTTPSELDDFVGGKQYSHHGLSSGHDDSFWYLEGSSYRTPHTGSEKLDWAVEV